MAKKIYMLAENALQLDLETDLAGGGEVIYQETIELLKSKNYEVYPYQFSYEKRVAKFRGHKIYGLGNMVKGYNSSQAYEQGMREFVAEAERNNADGIYYLSMNLAQVSSRIKSIVISHGLFFNDYQKNDYLKPIECLDMMKRALRNTSCMISCDTDTCHHVSVWCPQYVNKLQYICNYVDLDLFVPTKGKDDGTFRIIFPRRLDYARGFVQTEQMTDILLSKHDNMVIKFVGKGNEAESRQFNEWKSKHDNKKVIHEIKPHDHMPSAYAGMDLGIVATTKCEGTSLSLLELYASSIVPVHTWVGGLSDIGVNNFTSLVVNPNDPIALAEAVEYSMNNPNHMEEMRKNGQLFIKHFGKDRWEKQILNVFTNIYGEP